MEPLPLRYEVRNGHQLAVFTQKELEYHMAQMMKLDPGINNKGYPLSFLRKISSGILEVFTHNSQAKSPNDVLVQVEIKKLSGFSKRKPLITFIDYTSVKEYFEDYLMAYIVTSHLGLVEVKHPEYDKKIKEALDCPVDRLFEQFVEKSPQFYGITVYDKTTQETFCKVGTTENIVRRLKREHIPAIKKLIAKGHELDYEFSFFTTQKEYPHLNERTFKANCPSLVYDGSKPRPTVEYLFRKKEDSQKEIEVIVSDESRVLLDSLQKFHDDPERTGNYLAKRFQRVEIPAIWDNLINQLNVRVKNGRVLVTPIDKSNKKLTQDILTVFDVKDKTRAPDMKITDPDHKRLLLKETMTDANMYPLWHKLSHVKNHKKQPMFPQVYKSRQEFKQWHLKVSKLSVPKKDQESDEFDRGI
jgi:hypothetical protein